METEQLIDSNELTKLLQPANYCGILLIDGKFLPVKEIDESEGTKKQKKSEKSFIPRSAKRRGKTGKGLVAIAGIDYLSHDIPEYIVALSENIFDVGRYFKELKAQSYPLRILVCDESIGDFIGIAKEYYPNVIIQICLTHYSRVLERTFVCAGAKRTYEALRKKLRYLGESFFIPTRHYDRERGIKITNHMADLEHKYGYLWEIQEMFQELFGSISTIDELNKWEDELNVRISEMNIVSYPYKEKILNRYHDYYKKREQIIAFILHPDLDIPKTTNLIEGWNSTTMELRLASIRGFEKEKSARDYVNAVILKYRFHIFTDCKTKFKHLNGKSPLQISQPTHTFGFDFLNTKGWINFCRKMKKAP